jgi:hypothetical protein
MRILAVLWVIAGLLSLVFAVNVSILAKSSIHEIYSALNYIIAALMFSFAGMFVGLAKIADRLAPPKG